MALTVALLIMLFASIYLLIRNQFVHGFLTTRIKEASHCSRYIIDVSSGAFESDYLEPYHRLNEVSYDQMLHSFFPLKHFIQDDWLDDLYEEYKEIADAERAARIWKNNVGKGVLVGSTNGNVETNQQGRPESDVGCGEVEQG